MFESLGVLSYGDAEFLIPVGFFSRSLGTINDDGKMEPMRVEYLSKTDWGGEMM